MKVIIFYRTFELDFLRENNNLIIKTLGLRKIPSYKWIINNLGKHSLLSYQQCIVDQSDYLFGAENNEDLIKRLELIGIKTKWAKILELKTL